MTLTIYTDDGQLIQAVDGPPWQFTPEGFNTWLSTNSVPLSQWDGSGGNYKRLYEEQIWVAAAVNKLARQVARLPLKVYERDSQGNKQRLLQGRLVDAIARPAPGKGPVDLKQWLVFPVLLHGNGGVRKTRRNSGAPPSGFEPRTWELLQPHDDDYDDRPEYWVYDRGRGTREVIQPADLVHVSWHPPAGFLGVSPLKQLGVTLRIEGAAQRYQEAAFRNSVRPSGAVEAPEGVVLDRETKADIRADLNRIYAGPENAGRPVLLPGGLKWNPMSHTAQEAELIDQRKLTREEVAAVYDVPPPMIGILDQATYSNISEQHQMLFTTVLGPWLVLLEETFKAQVIDPEPAFEGQWVEFDLKEVLRGDPVKEAVALRTQLQAGVLTINEAREILNLAPIDHPDANRPMVPVNNIAFVGGEQPASEADDEALADATTKAITRLAEISPTFAAAARAALNGHHDEE